MRKLLTAILVTLVIPMGIAWSHPVYDERGNIVGEKEEPSLKGVVISGHLEYPSECGEYPGILDLLRECLKYIEDGSVDQGVVFDTLVYHPITRDGVAQDEADRAAYEAERYRRETELNKKIKAMIKKLEGENK